MLVNFRIGGAVWGERVQYEPLTDVVNLLPLWQQEPVSLRLARQMQALCICAKELLAEYSIQPLGISTQRSLLYANGVPPVLHDSTRCVALHHGQTCFQHEMSTSLCLCIHICPLVFTCLSV